MAIVKVMPRHSAAKVISYVYNGRTASDPLDAEMCSTEEKEAIAQFEAVRRMHAHRKGDNEVMHVIQSWSVADSQKLTPQEANELGRKLVQEYWQGHQFLVVTHTDKNQLHNHIVVNTMHMETGKHIPNKKVHWKSLARINDQICLEKGLGVMKPAAKTKEPKLSDKAKRVMQFNGNSYLMDISQKADFARTYSTSYDQYRAVLFELGVHVQIEKENITYFYPGRERGKRGDKLGKFYDKPALEAAFKSNDERFARHPELREKLRGEKVLFNWQKERASAMAARVSGLPEKDYSRYTPVARGHRGPVESPELQHAQGMIPLDELRRARSGNILAYCKQNKIELVNLEGGKLALKGREHVVLSDYECVNQKSGCRGSLIDFVAAHKNLTYVQAISKINKNPNLLLLEKTFGEQKRTFTPFHVPRENALEGKKAEIQLARLLEAHGTGKDAAGPLLARAQAHVHRDGVIHIVPRGEATGALEFNEDAEGRYTHKKKGEFTTPFFSVRGSGRKAAVFTDPFTYIDKRSKNIFSSASRSEGILSLMEPNERLVDEFLVQNPHVKELELVQSKNPTRAHAELDFFNVLKSKYKSFGIGVELVGHDKALGREGPELSR